MKREQILEAVRSYGTACGREIETFIQYYLECADYLHQKCVNHECSERDERIVEKLEHWLEDEGVPAFLDALRLVPADACDEIKDFVSLYRFLLENSRDSVEKLVDHMFCIPGQFVSDFVAEQVKLIGIIGETPECVAVKDREEYIFNGNLERGSLFFRYILVLMMEDNNMIRRKKGEYSRTGNASCSVGSC